MMHPEIRKSNSWSNAAHLARHHRVPGWQMVITVMPKLACRVPQSFSEVSRKGRLLGMPTTTIKVDSAIRDRLAHLARARGTTMSALLSDVAEQLETEQRWSDIEAAYQRMQHQDPDGWAEYLDELAEWEVSTPITDTAATQEWPEYNR
jgi:predicted transcriptional regulator